MKPTTNRLLQIGASVVVSVVFIIAVKLASTYDPPLTPAVTVSKLQDELKSKQELASSKTPSSSSPTSVSKPTTISTATPTQPLTPEVLPRTGSRSPLYEDINIFVFGFMVYTVILYTRVRRIYKHR